MTNDHIKKEKTTRLVKHQFSNQEKQAFGEELANAHAMRTAAQNDLDTMKKQIGARITEADGMIAKCVEQIRSGFEMRREPCTAIKDFRACTITVIRDATGEVVEERTMTSEEAQVPLPFEEGQGLAAVPDAEGDETEGAATAAAEAEEEGEEDQGGEKEEKGPESGEPAGEETKPFYAFEVGKTYKIVVQRKKKKRTYKDLEHWDVKSDSQGKLAHVFIDPAGKKNIFLETDILSIEPIKPQ